MKKVCFYQFAHIGDLLLSLPFIEFLINNCSQYDFFHTTETEKSVGHFKENLFKIIPTLKISQERNSNFEIRTWIGHIKEDYLNNQNISYDQFNDSFELYKFLWTKIYKQLDCNICINEDLEINFNHELILDKISLKKIKEFFDRNKNKKNVLLFNQTPFSEQTDLTPWVYYIKDIANKFPNINFIYTNSESFDYLPNNVFWSPNLFGIHNCDIIHNSYLSIFCDILVGRVSGPFMYSSMHTKNCIVENKIIIHQHGFCPNDFVCFFNKKLVKNKNLITRSSNETFLTLETTLNSFI